VSSLLEFQTLAQFPGLPQEMRSTQVVIRFALRIVILVIFASFAGIGFGRSLAALLWMSTVFSAVVAAIRREPLFDTTLNHWDETAAYAALFCLAIIFHHAAAV
jgi:uncharacterized membrane protein YcaP (DUF421 family)